MGLTPATSHSPPQWRGWVPPRELAQQGRGMIPGRMMALPCRVRALNARTRVRERACVRGSLERGGGEPSSEAKPARGGREPSSEAEPARGRSEPSSEAELARGGL
jgi:hypothetical protein